MDFCGPGAPGLLPKLDRPALRWNEHGTATRFAFAAAGTGRAPGRRSDGKAGMGW